MLVRTLICLGSLTLAAHAQNMPVSLTPQQQAKLMDQAKHAYYNLHTAGASGLVTCQAVMTWDNHWATQDKGLPHIAHGEQIAAALKTVKFKVILHTDNSIEPTALNLPKLADPREAEWQEAVVARMRGALVVLMQGWARYEVRSAFERTDIPSRVLDLGSRYAILYTVGKSEENIQMNRDFMIDSIHFRNAVGESGSSRPRFTSTPDGYLVNGWDIVVSGPMALSVLRIGDLRGRTGNPPPANHRRDV